MTWLYLDNDVISKLASCDLLDDAVAALDFDKAAVRILDTFKHRFGITDPKRRAKIERQLGEAVFQRLLVFQRAVGGIEAVRNELILPFEDLPAVDVGEAILFAAASEVPESRLVTGDKRSLRSLAEAESCRPMMRSLSGRVLCFEQVIAKIISLRGFEQAKRKIIPAVACDTALRAAFGMGLDAEEPQVLRVLHAYIAELRDATGNLLGS